MKAWHDCWAFLLTTPQVKITIKVTELSQKCVILHSIKTHDYG